MATQLEFKPAVRANVPLLIGFDGPSGSGKTFTALEVATGIASVIGEAQGRAGRIFGIDTERGRMLHYADDFTFMYGELQPPFSPGSYGAAIAAAERAGADVVVIDSFSHVWEGEGGVREMADAEEAAGKKAPSQWIEPKTKHKRLVNQMLASRAHVIVCMRSEEKMRVEAVLQFNDDGTPKMWKGKQSTRTVITPASDIPIKDRWVPICEKRFPFEITTSFLLTADRPGVGIPRKLQKQHMPFFPEGEQIGRHSGELIGRWAIGGAVAPSPEKPSTHPTATLEARADKLEVALKSATTLERLTTIWTTNGPLRADLAQNKPLRLEELTRVWRARDTELEDAARPTDGGQRG